MLTSRRPSWSKAIPQTRPVRRQGTCVVRPVAVLLDTGAGNDTATVLLRDIDLAGRLRAMVAARDRDDRVSARAGRTLFLGPARLGMTVRGGPGIDVLDLAMVDPTGHQFRGGHGIRKSQRPDRDASERDCSDGRPTSGI
jgi:hypothetical protein